MMVKDAILERLEKLPASLQTEALHYIEFLLQRYTRESSPKEMPNKKRKAGLLKGKIWMSEDFDEPLEELKDYM